MSADATKSYPTYTASEAARLLGVTPPTIARYLDAGLLRAADIAAGRFRFVDGESLLELKRQRDLGKGRK